MLPHAIFEETLTKWVYPIGNAVGLNFLDPNYKVTLPTFITGFFVSLLFFFTLASLRFDDPQESLLCLYEWQVSVQVIYSINLPLTQRILNYD